MVFEPDGGVVGWAIQLRFVRRNPANRNMTEREIVPTPAENSGHSQWHGPREHVVISVRDSGLSGHVEWRTMVNVGMDGIDKHHARDFVAMARGEDPEVESAEVVPHEDVRAGNRSAGEEAVQFVGDIRAGARLIGRAAPTKTGAIVGTNTGKSTDLRLNELPNKGRVVWTGLQDGCGAACAGTVDVKSQSTDVHEFARRRIAIVFPFRHRQLKYGASDNNQGHRDDEPFASAP